MLNSRKGNLSCFQWEVERFQQVHREKMAAISRQTCTKPTAAQQQQQRHRRAGGLRKKLPREQLAEIEVRKSNALMVERMTEIDRVGGFQRRCLHEFQDVNAALTLGKTNVGISRAAHEHRFIKRKKIQERVRRENAKLIARLASPKRSGIDFNKFEADFTKSREHCRMAQCNRTVGHTSVLSTAKARAPCSGGDSTAYDQAPSRQRQPPKNGRHRDPASRVLRQRSSLPVGQRSDSSPTLGGRKPPSGAGNRTRGGSNNGRRPDESSDVAPCRPCTAVGGSRRSIPAERPHTALGLRRGNDHHDLFDARAADPGWGDGGTSRAHHRPPSAPERRRESAEFSAVRQRRPPSSRFFSDDGGVLVPGTCRTRRPKSTGNRMGRWSGHASDGGDGEDDSGEIVRPSDGGTLEFQAEEENGGGTGGRSWCLGRTLLVEAKVLINGPNIDKKRTSTQGGWRGGGGGGGRARRRGRMKVGLRFLSLDGLIRQREGVRKTLRGFAVEASLGDGGGTTGSTSVSVSAVQAYLENADLGAAGDGLESFREARPLDERGNYRELNVLLGRAGQRALYEVLLASCRVVTSGDRGGKVGVQLLRVNAGGAGISATAIATAATRTAPGIGAHRSRPREGAVRSAAGSAAATEGVVRGSATPFGVGGCSRGTSGRGGDKNSPIVVRIPPATSDPVTSPRSPSQDGSESGGEEQEEEDEEEEEEEDDEID